MSFKFIFFPFLFEKYYSRILFNGVDIITDFCIILKVDKDYNLTTSLNPEIKTLWYEISIRKKYVQAWPYTNQFMLSEGGIEYLLPLYRAWNDVNRETAIQIFIAGYNFYHPMVRDRVRKILNYY